MLKDAILKQKVERDEFLKRIKRGDYYEREIEKKSNYYLENTLIKAVLGPRRAGKSVFLFRLLQNENFAYFNFESEEIKREDFSYSTFLDMLKEVYGDFKYIFFDEVQNLPYWESIVNQLHRNNYNVFVTDSNASLLSKELATALTGRHLPIEILPFSWREISKLKETRQVESLNKMSGEDLARKYLFEGGFPEIILNQLNHKEYLEVLYEAIIFKDMIRRFNLRNSNQIYALGNYFLSNIGSSYKARRLFKKLEFKSDVTFEKYFNMFSDAYVLFGLQNYSFRSSSRIVSPRKVYTVDNGFVQSVGVLHSANYGKFLENAVFVELMKSKFRPNWEVFYYKTKSGKEVDFLIKNGLVVEKLIQVCFSLDNKETEEREVSALVSASKELGCEDLIIISWAEEREILMKGKKIRVIPFIKYFTGPVV